MEVTRSSAMSRNWSTVIRLISRHEEAPISGDDSRSRAIIFRRTQNSIPKEPKDTREGMRNRKISLRNDPAPWIRFTA